MDLNDMKIGEEIASYKFRKFTHASCFLMLAVFTFVHPLIWVGSVSAAEINRNLDQSDREIGCSLKLVGQIEDGDLDKLKAAMSQFDEEVLKPGREITDTLGREKFWKEHLFVPFSPAKFYGDFGFTHRLCLNSPGGSLAEALRIIEFFHAESRKNWGGITTGLSAGDTCESACALIFLSGVFRRFYQNLFYDERAANSVMHQSAKLGLHAPYIDISRESMISVNEFERAWSLGMYAVSLIVEAMARGEMALTPGALARMLETSKSEMFYIDTVGDSIKFRINIPSVSPDQYQLEFDERQLLNVCDNAAILAPATVGLERRRASEFSDVSFGFLSEDVYFDRFTDERWSCIVGMKENSHKTFEDWFKYNKNQELCTNDFGCFIEDGYIPVFFKSSSKNIDGYSTPQLWLPPISIFPPSLRLEDLAVEWTNRVVAEEVRSGTVEIAEDVNSSFNSAETAHDFVNSSLKLSAIYSALTNYFPKEAILLIDRFEESDGLSIRGEAAVNVLLEIVRDIQGEQSWNLLKANDLILQEVIQLYVLMTARLKDDVGRCNLIIVQGPTAIPEDERDRILPYERSENVLFKAMHQGLKFPVQRSAATDDDWSQLVAFFFTKGGTKAQLRLFLEPDVKSPYLCEATLQVFRALKTAHFPGADRVRAEAVYEMYKDGSFQLENFRRLLAEAL